MVFEKIKTYLAKKRYSRAWSNLIYYRIPIGIYKGFMLGTVPVNELESELKRLKKYTNTRVQEVVNKIETYLDSDDKPK